jgi:hypothetical protein
MLPPPRPSDPLWALAVATIYFGSFITVGLIARLILDRVMRQSGVHLQDVHAQAGPNRPKRMVFLLGAWRSED